ncbi:MAG: hypothetical protein ACM3XR_05900 [Bacillota bacterium]
MARIKIVDLPADMKITPEEMKKVLGGAPRKVYYANPFDAVLMTEDPVEGARSGFMTEDPELAAYSNPLDGVNIRNAPRTVTMPVYPETKMP